MKIGNTREKGVAVIEMAIMLPIFILILIGIVEFGLIMHENLILQNATREAARFGSLGTSEAAIEDRARDFALQLNNGSLTVNVANAQGERGSTLIVKTSYPVPLLTKSMAVLTGGKTFTLRAEARMRLE